MTFHLPSFLMGVASVCVGVTIALLIRKHERGPQRRRRQHPAYCVCGHYVEAHGEKGCISTLAFDEKDVPIRCKCRGFRSSFSHIDQREAETRAAIARRNARRRGTP